MFSENVTKFTLLGWLVFLLWDSILQLFALPHSIENTSNKDKVAVIELEIDSRVN